jgi:hypothetical protein
MKTKKINSRFSLQLQTCFTAEELWQFRYGKAEPSLRLAVQAHLSQDRCKSCTEIFLTLPPEPIQADRPDSLSAAGQKLLKKWAGKTSAIKIEEHPANLTAGQMWSTKACLSMSDFKQKWNAPIGGPVMIVHPGENIENRVIRVMPISADMLFVRPPATLMISDATLPTNPMLVEIFNERPMLAEHLDRYLGQIGESDLVTICNARNAYIDMTDDGEPTDPDYDKWVKHEIRLAEHLSAPAMAMMALDIWDEEVILPPKPSPEPPYMEESTVPVIPPWMISELMIEPFYMNAQGTEAAETLPPEPLILLDQPEFQLGLVQKQDKIVLRLVSTDASSFHIQIDGAAVELLPVSGDVQELVIGYALNMPDQMEIIIFYQDKKWEFQPKFTVKK